MSASLQAATARHNVHLSGSGRQPIVFAHGFGCDQKMWRFVAPDFERTHRVVLFDHLGCGASDPQAYDAQRHAQLDGYAEDVVQLLEAMDLRDVVFVGHSVSAMIGALAAIRAPQRFARLVMVGPSPRYLNEPPHYHGGFEPEDIEGLALMMERNLAAWAEYLAGEVSAETEHGPSAQELRASFCASDPDVLKRFARATFLADNRADLARVRTPTLVLQVEHDAIAPLSVGRFCHEQLAGSTLTVLPTTGHCPHMTHPAQTVAAIRDYLSA